MGLATRPTLGLPSALFTLVVPLAAAGCKPAAGRVAAPGVDVAHPPCGGCPHGFTCGPSGTCKSASGVPHFSHVFLIYMENSGYTALMGNPNAPYLNQLADTWGLATRYYGVTHPSLPNYLALTSGQTFDLRRDCGPLACGQDAPNLADSLEQAGLTWHAYAESMRRPCDLVSIDPYAARHNPFVYFADIRNSRRCAANDVDYSRLAPDLAAGGFTFASITPNLCDDMHDRCTGNPTKQGDEWLARNVPLLLASPEWKQGGVLFITWDESESEDPRVPTLVISPLGKRGYRSTAQYDHYSLLATIEDGLGLPRLGESAGAPVMADFFD